MVRTVDEPLPRGLVTLRILGASAGGIPATGFAGPFKSLLLVYSCGSFLVTLIECSYSMVTMQMMSASVAVGEVICCGGGVVWWLVFLTGSQTKVAKELVPV